VNLPPAYRPNPGNHSPHALIVLEGISGVGKSTLSATLVRRMKAATLHTLPEPHSGWSKDVNEHLRPLPQFGFYLSGLLHGSDKIRRLREFAPVVADRYTSSVLACHAAVHGLTVKDVGGFLDPFRPYLETPTRTFYLLCSEPVLRERLAVKQDVKRDDTDLLTVPGRLARLLDNFAAVAADDPTAVVLHTDGMTPVQLADAITTCLEADRA
jgi:dTMP kinase